MSGPEILRVLHVAQSEERYPPEAMRLAQHIQRSAHTVKTWDGSVISMDLFRREGRDVVLIVCPGFFKSKVTPTFQRMSAALAVKYDVLGMDFRGHGRSSGLYTFSAREGADLEAVLEWARSRYQRIGIMGFSLGGAITINTVARSPGKIKTFVAVSAPAAFREIEFKFWTMRAIRTGLKGLEPGSGCRPGNLFLKKIRPLDSIAHLPKIPVLFIHGTEDVIVGLEHSRRLFAAASEPKRLEVIEGGSHAEALYRNRPDSFTHLITDWLDSTLF